MYRYLENENYVDVEGTRMKELRGIQGVQTLLGGGFYADFFLLCFAGV